MSTGYPFHGTPSKVMGRPLSALWVTYSPKYSVLIFPNTGYLPDSAEKKRYWDSDKELHPPTHPPPNHTVSMLIPMMGINYPVSTLPNNGHCPSPRCLNRNMGSILDIHFSITLFKADIQLCWLYLLNLSQIHHFYVVSLTSQSVELSSVVPYHSWMASMCFISLPINRSWHLQGKGLTYLLFYPHT